MVLRLFGRLNRARRASRDAYTPAEALAHLRRQVEAVAGSVEERLLDRRCRCSRPAAQLQRDCLWHDAVSAQYAADLERLVRELLAAVARDA